MSEEIDLWTGSITGGPYSSSGYVETGSQGQYLLAGEIRDILQGNYIWLSDNVGEEQQLLKILYNEEYDEVQREFLRTKIGRYNENRFHLLVSRSLDE